MRVVGRRQTGADVEELADSRDTNEVRDDALEEPPVFDGSETDAREDGCDGITGSTVGGEMVFSAEPVVVPAGRVGDVDVEPVEYRPIRVGYGRCVRFPAVWWVVY